MARVIFRIIYGIEKLDIKFCGNSLQQNRTQLFAKNDFELDL